MVKSEVVSVQQQVQHSVMVLQGGCDRYIDHVLRVDNIVEKNTARGI